jgi:predicted chitinase
MLTEQQIRAMMPNAGKRLDPHLPFIGPALAEGRIDTPRRIAAFMAQLAHESGEYRYMEELADGSAYEGRADLGNTQPGDGRRFKGRGPIQITGRANYAACGAALGLDLLADPTLLARPEHGTASACWFWNSRDLSLLADQDWFRLITRRINGGFNGLADRLQYWDRNREILGLPPIDPDNEMGSIMEFQARHGLTADGVVGPKTIAALKAETAARAAA